MKSLNQNCDSRSGYYDPAETRRAVEDAISRSKEYPKTERGDSTAGESDSKKCRPDSMPHRLHNHSCLSH
jgi:hypothetical protein